MFLFPWFYLYNKTARSRSHPIITRAWGRIGRGQEKRRISFSFEGFWKLELVFRKGEIATFRAHRNVNLASFSLTNYPPGLARPCTRVHRKDLYKNGAITKEAVKLFFFLVNAFAIVTRHLCTRTGPRISLVFSSVPSECFLTRLVFLFIGGSQFCYEVSWYSHRACGGEFWDYCYSCCISSPAIC